MISFSCLIGGFSRELSISQKYVCDEGRRGLAFCENILFLLSGSDPANFNAAELPLITAHTPAGTSTYTPIHYLQEYLAGNCIFIPTHRP